MNTPSSHLTLVEAAALFRYETTTGQLFWRNPEQGRKSKGLVGTLNHKGYLYTRISGRIYKVHRLIWLLLHGEHAPSDMHVDHIDGNKLNNRIENLRLLTNAESQTNRHHASSKSKLGIMGVRKNKRRFTAEIYLHGVRHRLGSFGTAEEASMAYVSAKKRLHPKWSGNYKPRAQIDAAMSPKTK